MFVLYYDQSPYNDVRYRREGLGAQENRRRLVHVSTPYANMHTIYYTQIIQAN